MFIDGNIVCFEDFIEKQIKERGVIEIEGRSQNHGSSGSS
jgi:hypothetical protein